MRRLGAPAPAHHGSFVPSPKVARRASTSTRTFGETGKAAAKGFWITIVDWVNGRVHHTGQWNKESMPRELKGGGGYESAAPTDRREIHVITIDKAKKAALPGSS